jgi:chemotaxis protein CheY-P-specific phosphatase CheC
LTELQQDAIIELLNIGMSRAALALSQMVGEGIHIKRDTFMTSGT